jgi:RimJ/RimL family protein N-acetyltransferase
VFDEHWDNGKFHKAFTWVRPENEVALALLRRYGYEQAALLRQQIFGQDYVVMEKFYTKVTEDYDSGMSMGRVARMKARIDTLLGR